MVSQRRAGCGACDYQGLEVILDLGLSPVADAYTDAPDATSDRYPLKLAVCTGCGLVQLLDVVDQATLFGTGYSFYSSASAPLSAYHERYANQVLDTYRHLAKNLTVEVGCNDGDLLRHFTAADCRAIGVDPSDGPVTAARERGLTVWNESFNLDVARRLWDLHGPAGVIIANHVLAHVESVSDVLAGIRRLLADDGVCFIEVQYLPDLLVNNAFDLVYHEHRNFFTLTSLQAALQRWDLYVNEAMLTDRQGGSLRVEVGKHAVGGRPNVERLLASERWLTTTAYHGLQGRVDRIRDRLRDLLTGFDGAVLGYGAPAKATTLLNYCHLDDGWIDKIVDTTLDKQGRYVPGTGIKIVPPEMVHLNDYSCVMILAWNYASTVMRNHPAYVGQWLLPIPSPVLL